MSQISIINRALSYIGANKIEALTDDTQEAKAILNVYDFSLCSILAEAPWVFALKRSLLTRAESTPVWGGGILYNVPNDLIRIFDTTSKNNWRQEGKYIVSDESSFGVLYTYKETDDTTYSPSFIDAFTVRLASDVSFDLLNSSTKQNELMQFYKTELLPIARSINAQSRIAPQVNDDHWVNAIYGG